MRGVGKETGQILAVLMHREAYGGTRSTTCMASRNVSPSLKKQSSHKVKWNTLTWTIKNVVMVKVREDKARVNGLLQLECQSNARQYQNNDTT